MSARAERLPDARRAALREAKLRALVEGHWGAGILAPAPDADASPHLAAIADATGRGWALIDDGEVRSFGASLAWAWRQGIEELHVLVEDPVGAGGAVIARRAALFQPSPRVWRVDGRGVEQWPRVGADGPRRVEVLPDRELESFAELIRSHGADPVFEHDSLTAEVLGLEVARARMGEDGWELVVGVGRHDRDARAQMRPGQRPAEALTEVVTEVRNWRRAGAARHPANSLAPERWLRSVIIARPAIAGAHHLRALPSPRRSIDLREPSPAPAGGTARDESPVVVVCSTGIDLDLVATAADARHLWDRAAKLLLVVPDGDDYPVTRALAAALAQPADVMTVPRDWSHLSD
ncbi:MAG: hypothetical protein ACR2KC_05125 [Acidimicrobiales bacterium]